MKLGVVNNETWAFFHEIYKQFSLHHDTEQYQSRRLDVPVFSERINRFVESRRLRTFLSQHDVVFFEWASEMLVRATHLPKSCGIVARLHRYELYHWAHQIRWDAIDRIILVSEAKKREFCERFPDQASKVSVIPEAISLDQFNGGQKQYQGDIGILCHLSPRKRVYELVLTFHELLERGGEYKLHIGGAGHSRFPDYEPTVRSLVHRLGLDTKVKFYGPVTDPADWYRNIDIFVSNSYSEGLQVSPMEAIASGCYCVSHWWDGADELLAEDHLYFTDRGLIDLIEDYNQMSPAQREGLRAIQHAVVTANFDIEKTAARIREIVEQAAS
jgi:glycosyltransferase involved in cell wall biosynthesis